MTISTSLVNFYWMFARSQFDDISFVCSLIQATLVVFAKYQKLLIGCFSIHLSFMSACRLFFMFFTFVCYILNKLIHAKPKV